MKRAKTEELTQLAMLQITNQAIYEAEVAIKEFIECIKAQREAERCRCCGFWFLDPLGLKCDMCEKEKNERQIPENARIPNRRRARLPE